MRAHRVRLVWPPERLLAPQAGPAPRARVQICLCSAPRPSRWERRYSTRFRKNRRSTRSRCAGVPVQARHRESRPVRGLDRRLASSARRAHAQTWARGSAYRRCGAPRCAPFTTPAPSCGAGLDPHARGALRRVSAPNMSTAAPSAHRPAAAGRSRAVCAAGAAALSPLSPERPAQPRAGESRA